MHYYINKDTIFRACDTYSLSWHCGNSWGNGNLIGYEVCQSMGASDRDFLANEEMTIKQVAEDFKYYGITPSRNTVFLHRALSSTSCPHRSWDLHVGRGASDTTANRNKLVDYFVARIKHYMGGGGTPAPKPTPKPKPEGFNINNYHTSKPKQIVLVKDDWAYKEVSLKNKAEKTPRGTVLTVTDLVYSGKYPRYKLKSGLFITTRKDTVSPFDGKAPSGGGAKGTIKVGSKVKVTNPVSYDGVRLSVSGTYDVMELKGNRAVIGRGGQVTTAINVNNLALA